MPSSTKKSRNKSFFTVQRYEPRTRQQHAIANCKIFRLNDDCLFEIFSYLPTIDLCAVKDTCRRFNALSDSIMQNRWKGKAFACGNIDGRNERENTLILQHFGYIVENVMILKQETVYPTVQKCGVKKRWIQLKHYTSLKMLTMFSQNINCLPTYRLKRTLQNLVSLNLERCVGDDSEFARIINSCINLKHLRANETASISILASICHESSNIESLDFVSNDRTSRFSNEPQTDEDEIHFTENLTKLQNLRKLNSLQIACNGYSVTSAIAPLAKKESIECIQLFNSCWDESLDKAFTEWAVVDVQKPWFIVRNTFNYVFRRHSPTVPIIVID